MSDLIWRHGRRLALLLVLVVFACAPKQPVPPTVPRPVPPPPAPVQPPVAVPEETGKELFEEAERLYAEKRYLNALNNYNEYLYGFPAGPFAADALWRTASIYMAIAAYENASSAYARLINEHPDSPFTPGAHIELLFSLYNEGKYPEVIQAASAVKADTLSKDQLIRVSRLMGGTYLALGSPADAVTFYSMAYHAADPAEKAEIMPDIKTSIQKLNVSAIIDLLGRLADAFPADYLMFQLGIKKAEEEKFDAAIAILSAFVEKYPDHEYVPLARTLLQEFVKDFQFNRYAIGCLLPLSGPYKLYGQRSLAGIQLALAQFAARNKNAQIKLVIKDTGSDPDKAVQAVRELVKENVAAIIGPLTVIEPAALEAQDNGIPIITLTQKEYIPDIGDFVFRNFFTPKMQIKALVSFAVDKLGLSRFAILYPDESYGETFMNLFWDEVVAHNGIVVGVESYQASQMDFADPIKKLVGRYYEVPQDLKDPIELIAETFVKPVVEASSDGETARSKSQEDEPPSIVDFDAVFIPDAPKKAGLIIPQLAFYDVSDAYLLGTNLWNSNELIQMAREYMQRAVIPAGFFADSSSGPVRFFVDGFLKTFGATPGFIEAVSYDTAGILFDLTNRLNAHSRAALRDALISLKNYQGVTGLTSFEPNGDVCKEFYFLGVRGNHFVDLKNP